ncbi:uncharacterized protein LOC141674055 [Apium graveolens]|uniref:uncharacterized protein LOC141674055 n=1 Tax=Apium graveolens TaxID=4045 RepID=UPI003D7B5557
MEPPRTIKDVQKLTGRIAALKRFISKSGDKCLPFFKTLKKVKDFEWIAESQEASEQLKKYMTKSPLLAKPCSEDTLYLYLAVTEQAVSAVLVKEEQKLRKPVYYVSKVLHEAELNYSTMEKFALALITASRKLRPYFQAHKIKVLTDQPLRNILHSPKASIRLITWAIELGEFDIKYMPRTSIKAQALVDFMVECTINDQEIRGQEIVTPEGGKKEKDEEITLKEYWILRFDGASKTKSSGAGLVLQIPDGFMIEYTLKLDFPTTNNEAEYEALIDGLGLPRAVRDKNLKVCGDSKLVVAQVNGEFEAKDDTMAKYLRVVKGILTQFGEWYAERVSREENTTPDALSQFASSEIENYPRSIYFQVLKTPTIHVINLIAPVGMTCCWIDPIKTHLETGWLPNDAQEARKLDFGIEILIEGLLYKSYPVHVGLRSRGSGAPKITHGSPRIEAYEPETNEEGLRLALDLIDEVWDEASARNAEHQERAPLYYNRRVKKVLSTGRFGSEED